MAPGPALAAVCGAWFRKRPINGFSLWAAMFSVQELGSCIHASARLWSRGTQHQAPRAWPPGVAGRHT